MAIFTYTAADQKGETRTGEQEAENERVLAHGLREQGLFLLQAQPKRPGAGAFNLHFDVNQILGKFRPVSVVEKMFFSRNLAVMVAAGLPLTKALEASAKESSNPKFKGIIQNVISSVVKGQSFADSLGLHPRVFGELYVNMIAVGETTGKLETVLKLLARQMKKDHELRSRIKGAMMYPAIILITLTGIGAMMMIYVVPTLTETIKELGVELPLSTRMIIFMSDLFANHGLYMAAGLIGIGIGAWRILKSKKGKNLFDRIILKIPIFGTLFQKFNLARFSRTLAYLISAGIPIVKGLEITAKVLGNARYRKTIERAAKEIQTGKQLNEILRTDEQLFHPLVIQMIQVGEETGQISSLLLRIALFYEEEVSNTTKNLSTIIEPILMVVIGAIVGFFAISMLQPIYGSLGNL